MPFLWRTKTHIPVYSGWINLTGATLGTLQIQSIVLANARFAEADAMALESRDGGLQQLSFSD